MAGGAVIVSTVASCVGTIGAGLEGTSPEGGAAGMGALLPARIRRLSNAEFDATTHGLLGTQQTFASMLPSDVRQGSYNAGGFPAASATARIAACTILAPVGVTPGPVS